jgi:hypothetical protein
MVAIMFFLLLFAGFIAVYVFSAIALKTMADNRNIENSWLAFVPIANFYLMGLMIGRVTIGNYTVDQPELVIPGIMVANIFLGAFPLVGGLISLLATAAGLFAFYQLYKQYAPENAILYTVLSLLVIPTPFILFSIKDRPAQL